MKRFSIFNYLPLIILLTSCEPTQEAEFKDRPVVDAILYAGESPVVTISKLIPFRDDALFSDADVNKLSVTITDVTDNVFYSLTPVGEGKYINESLVAESGHEYRLDFNYDNIPVTATTTVPDLPLDMRLNKTTISVRGYQESSETKAEPSGPGTPVELKWSNPEKSYYVVSYINIEESPSQIWKTDSAPEIAFMSEPTNDTIAMIQERGFSYYGTHRIVLSKVEPEYIIMCRTLDKTSGSMREVNANVVNGYGIFTGMSRDTRTLTVTRASW